MGLAAEGAVDVLVGQTSSSTEHEIFPELVQLSLGWLQVAHHVHEGLVLLVYDAKLLIQGVLYRVFLAEGFIVHNGDGVAHAAFYGLQGLLLSTIASDYHNGTTVLAVEGASHDVEGGWRHQGGLVHHHHVEMVQREVDI